MLNGSMDGNGVKYHDVLIIFFIKAMIHKLYLLIKNCMSTMVKIPFPLICVYNLSSMLIDKFTNNI